VDKCQEEGRGEEGTAGRMRGRDEGWREETLAEMNEETERWRRR